MSRLAVFFHPEAMEEAEAAVRWYSERSREAAAGFARELTQAVESLAEAPSRWPPFEGGTRRMLMRRFPFLVVYRDSDEAVEIIAVAHGRRRPGYWRDRLAGQP